MKTNFLIPSSFYAFMFPTGIIVIGLFLFIIFFPHSGLPDVLTCPTIDQFLLDDLSGKIELTDNDKQTLLEGMIWCVNRETEMKYYETLTGLSPARSWGDHRVELP